MTPFTAETTAAPGGGRATLPVLTIDMDGVFCRPFFGWNVGISSHFLDPHAEPRLARVSPKWVRTPLDALRFNPRRPLPDARTGLARLRKVRRLVVVTGRRTYPRWWLRRHGLIHLFDRVMLHETPLRNPHYKLEALDLLGAAEHIDDDPRTAQLLVQRSKTRVFLRTWPTNADTELDPRVQRVRDLHDLADRLGAPPL